MDRRSVVGPDRDRLRNFYQLLYDIRLTVKRCGAAPIPDRLTKTSSAMLRWGHTRESRRIQ